MTQQEQVQEFAGLVGLDIIEVQQHKYVAIFQDHWEQEVHLGIQHTTNSGTTFWVSANKIGKECLELSGLPFENNFNLGKLLVKF